MKQLIQKFFTSCLAVLVLLTSTGFSVYEHVCHFTGKVQLSADVPKACCPADTPPTTNHLPVVKKAACCDTHVKVFQLEVVSGISLEKMELIPVYYGLAPFWVPSFHGGNSAILDFVEGSFWLDFIPQRTALPLFLQLLNLRI